MTNDCPREVLITWLSRHPVTSCDSQHLTNMIFFLTLTLSLKIAKYSSKFPPWQYSSKSLNIPQYSHLDNIPIPASTISLKISRYPSISSPWQCPASHWAFAWGGPLSPHSQGLPLCLPCCTETDLFFFFKCAGRWYTWEEYSIVKARCRLGKSLTMSLNWKRKKLVSYSEKIHC